MRIVAGRWRGRRLVAPKGSATRPTADRVRESLFSALAARLGDDLGGARVLDLFAGSGALGLEALSRGASLATFVEIDPSALAALRRNLETLEADPVAHVLRLDALTAAGRPLPGAPFTLLFLDPPYRIDTAMVRDSLVRLGVAGSMARDALLVWEHSARTPIAWPEGFEEMLAKRYGDTAVDIASYRGGATDT